MSASFDGFVLRKPLVASSNSPFTASPDTVVLNRDTNNSGTSDRDEYLTAFVNDPNAKAVEYLVTPASTANLVVSNQTQSENPSQVDVDGKVFQFNAEGYAIKNVSVTPAPDFLDERAGVIRYDSVPSSNPTVEYQYEPLSVYYTRNDETRRFSFDDAKSRWSPLPGGPVDELGNMPEDGAMNLVHVEPETGNPHVVIGAKDAAPIPVTWLYGDVNWSNETIPLGEALASVQSGEIRFATDVASANEGKTVYQFRSHFFSREGSTGNIGTAGDDLYLNPIPEATEKPLIRVRYGSYLKVAPTTAPQSDEIVRWNPSTGKIEFTTTDYDGQPVYYDGIYNTDTPIFSYGPETVGTIPDPSANLSLFSTVELSFNASDYDPDTLIFYVDDTGHAFKEVKWRNDTADFSPSFEIPARRVEAHYDEGSGTLTLRLSFQFASDNHGSLLLAGTGDFYLENGITFRMFRSHIDPSNQKSIPDARNRVRVQDESVMDSIRPGTFSMLTQTPLQDVAGYSENTFFKLKQGLREQILQHEEDVVYNFDAKQLLWTQRETNRVYPLYQPSVNVKLNHEVLYDDNYEFELDIGEGFEPLNEGEDVLVDFNSGQISFTEALGKLHYEGVGETSSGTTFTATSVNFDFVDDLGADPSTLPDVEKPMLILEGDSKVYRIVDATSTTLEVHKPFGSVDTSAPFKVLSSPEVVYDYGMQPLSLTKRWVYPELITAVDTGNPSYVPDGESYEFLVNGSDHVHTVLEPTELGTLKDDVGNPNSLNIPSYYQDSTSRYTLYRDSKELTEISSGSPATDEYKVDGQGVITFNTTDVDGNPDAVIMLDPQLSVGRSTGNIEVLESNRLIGLPSDLLADTVETVVLLSEDQYDVQTSSGTMFFNSVMRSGSKLRVKYHEDESTEVIENVGFRVRETLNVNAGETSASFGAGHDLDTLRPTQFLVNGVPTSSSFDVGAKSVSFSPVRANRVVQVDYYVTEAVGGERIVQLLNAPYAPPVSVSVGSDQIFHGDHTDVLQPETVVTFGGDAYEVQSVSYDATSEVTTASFLPPVKEEMTDPDVFGSTKPVSNTKSVSVAIDSNSAGESELRMFGDVSNIIDELHVIYLDGAPHIVETVTFDESRSVTLVGLQNRLLREYSSPTVRMSEQPVYPPDTAVLLADNLAFAQTHPVRLIRFDENDDGTLIERDVQYRFLDDGSVFLDPANAELPAPGERWFLSYLARRQVGPFTFRGRRIIPKLRATYTRFINATSENDIAGSSLLASYSFYSPDSFYFRALPLEEYAGEVADKIGADARALSSSSGPTTSFGSSVKNHEKGNTSLIWTEGNLRDYDRVGRRFIEFYNKSAQGFEEYLQALDGRVVGDRSGQFRFYLAPDGQRGGEDPVTGELIPYYTNPDGSGTKHTSTQVKEAKTHAQEGYIRNSIDDVILVSKKPFELSLNGSAFDFEFKGTFKKAWEPSALSRFYPQRSNVATITAPDGDEDGDYEFFDDFLDILGDLQHDDILSIQKLSDRPARGWLTSSEVRSEIGGVYSVEVGMSFTIGESEAVNGGTGAPNLNQGDPDNRIPGFSQGDLVNLGRVIYEDDGQGNLVRQTEIYAKNMEVVSTPSTSDNRVKIKATSNTNVTTATDPQTLVGAGIVKKHDTLFVQSQSFLRQNFDYGLDSSEGELKNLSLPQFIADIFGQKAPEPLTYLDALITYKNQRTEPYRFPAMDGAPIDDDGLTGLPYSNPIPDSESVSFGAERAAHELVIDQTTEGIASTPTLSNGYTLQFGYDLEDPTANPTSVVPRPYDIVFMEDENSEPDTPDWSPGSTPFRVSGVNGPDLYLAAFEVEESGISYTLENAVMGNGEVDGGNPQKWNDSGAFDFTGLNPLSGTLTIDGGTPYTISTFDNGYVTVNSNITETGTKPYTITVTGTGNIDSDLHAFKDGTADFTGVGGSLTITSTYNDSSPYDVVEGANGVLYVYPDGIESGDIGSSPQTGVSVSSILVEGSGSKDGTDPTIWNDGTVDFTDYDGVSGPYLHVITLNGAEVLEVSTYKVNTLDNGLVVVDEDITETGTHSYVLSTTPNYATGSGAVDMAVNVNKIYTELDLSEQNIKAGHALVISSDEVNGGYYRVVAIEAVPDSEFSNHNNPYYSITLDRPLRSSRGTVSTDPQVTSHTFPMRWYSYNPRRFSEELPELRDALLQRRVIYQSEADSPTSPVDIQSMIAAGNYKSQNPSTPSLDVLENLIDGMFGTPIISGVDGEIVSQGSGIFSLDSASSTFGADGVSSEESYVLIENGEARGFYRTENVLSQTSIQLRDGEAFFQGNSGGYTMGLSPESGLSFKVYNASLFSERTYELVLYEYYNVLNVLDRIDAAIVATIHDPSKFIDSDPLIAHPGDPTDMALDLHITGAYSALPLGIDDRNAWISSTISVRDEINAILKATEDLYDLRFAWVDFRINMETGTLARRKRFASQKEKQMRKLVKELLKLSSSE